MVRHLFLVQSIVGSNPTIPAKNYENLVRCFNDNNSIENLFYRVTQRNRSSNEKYILATFISYIISNISKV